MDELSRVGQRALKTQPLSALVGARRASLSEGEAVLEVAVREELPQQDGFAHGGVVSFLADNAPIFTGGSLLGLRVLTQEYKINYVRPADGEKLSARASVVSAGRRHAVCRCDVFAADADGDETLCAAAQGTIAPVAPPEKAR